MELRKRRAAALAIIVGSTAQAASAQDARTSLFKVVTPKDDVVIGLSDGELSALGGRDAGASGDLQQMPSARIGVIANAALRVAPYTTPDTIGPHE